MRTLVIAIVLAGITLASLFIFQGKPPATDPASAITQQTLPWQIELADGSTRVFGLTLGKSRMADVARKAGGDFELALVTRPGQAETLELYTGNFKAGGIRGSLLAVAEIQAAEIGQLRQQLAIKKDYLETGSIKTTLRFEQQQAALLYPVRSLMFFPVASLDQGLVEDRFGKPERVLQTAEQVSHYLYPRLGLVVMINGEGKDMLQYVSPSAFAAVQYGIQWQAETYASQR